MVKAIVSVNWGDERKDRITDILARESGIIIRFQGGGNAGHTIINDCGKFTLHLLPSGVFYQHTTSIINNGVALNIPYLIQEIESLAERGAPKPGVLVSDRAQVLTPYHVLFDTYEEARLAGKSFGSAKPGIAPSYSDKYAKIGLQVSESFDKNLLREKAYRVCELKDVLLEHLYHKPLLDPKKTIKELSRCRDMITPYVCDVSAYLHETIEEGRNILLEDQLGSPKDPDHETYPMVTSSSTLAAYGTTGTGIPPYEAKDITAIVKAYSSAVGAGAFVSEIFGDGADKLRNRGGDGEEYGAIAGRPRHMGWLDVVATRHGCRIQGATEVAFTVLDVLGYLDKVPVCAGYRVGEQVTKEFPTISRLEKVRLVLIRLPGWRYDIHGIKRYQGLPESCRKCIELVEEEIEAPISMVSNGSGGDSIIVRR